MLRIISAWPQEERRLKQLAFLLFVCLFQDNNNNNNITNDCLFSFTVNKMIQFIQQLLCSFILSGKYSGLVIILIIYV